MRRAALNLTDGPAHRQKIHFIPLHFPCSLHAPPLISSMPAIPGNAQIKRSWETSKPACLSDSCVSSGSGYEKQIKSKQAGFANNSNSEH